MYMLPRRVNDLRAGVYQRDKALLSNGSSTEHCLCLLYAV
jgi:hypothetical protein